jgi:hypothetical protein
LEPGELVDSGPPVATAASTGALQVARTADPAALGRGAVVRDLEAIALHGHEHCSLASAMRESRVVPRPPVVVPAPIAIDDLELTMPRAAATHHRSLYRTAPKTSPPA